MYSFDYSTFANVVDGGRISGATTSALVISNALAADSADYLVVASNASGAVTSTVAHRNDLDHQYERSPGRSIRRRSLPLSPAMPRRWPKVSSTSLTV